MEDEDEVWLWPGSVLRKKTERALITHVCFHSASEGGRQRRTKDSGGKLYLLAQTSKSLIMKALLTKTRQLPRVLLLDLKTVSLVKKTRNVIWHCVNNKQETFAQLCLQGLN